MKKSGSKECPWMADNAEDSVKCKKCGNMVSVGGTSPEGTIPCPICGAVMSLSDTLDTSTSNEDY